MHSLIILCFNLYSKYHQKWQNDKPSIVVIIRANVLSNKGIQFTDPYLKNIRSRDDLTRSQILIHKLQQKFGKKYPIKPFYGNISIAETSRLFANAVAVVGTAGAGFSNLIFTSPSTVAIFVISKKGLEYDLYQHKNTLPTYQHLGVALKIGLTPRMVIAENLKDDSVYPYEIVVNELAQCLVALNRFSPKH